MLRTLFCLLILTTGTNAIASDASSTAIIKTNVGDIHIRLNEAAAPKTVNNFRTYVNSGFYTNTVFHRIIKGFMIQGGGYDTSMKKKKTNPPIKNEAANGLKNITGSIAMARTQDINSATSQFFINVNDNNFLNHGYRDYGYAVFGQVIKGMNVVKKIAATPTNRRDQPETPVVILNVTIQ